MQDEPKENCTRIEEREGGGGGGGGGGWERERGACVRESVYVSVCATVCTCSL